MMQNKEFIIPIDYRIIIGRMNIFNLIVTTSILFLLMIISIQNNIVSFNEVLSHIVAIVYLVYYK